MVGGQLVEAFDVGVTAVGRHLLIDFSQDLFDFAADFCRSGSTSLAHVLDRPSAAHGRAAEAFQRVAVTAGGQRTHQRQKKNLPTVQKISPLLTPR
ncbi:hypothetical protein D3C87_1320130 [compost metagenome]